MPRGVILAATAVTIALQPLAGARAQKLLPRVPEVNMVRLEGHLGPPRPTDKGATNLWLNHAGKEYRFQLTELRVLTGSRTASRILADVQPYRPSFFLRGADTMAQRLAGARSNDRIQINGYLRAGARDLMVTEVTVSPATSPAPAGTRNAT